MKNLKPNCLTMYEKLGTLQNEIVPEGNYNLNCFNHKKKWTPNEKRMVNNNIEDIWNLDSLRILSKTIGRSPYSIFNIYACLN